MNLPSVTFTEKYLSFKIEIGRSSPQLLDCLLSSYFSNEK